jgi:hypothetical protein
MARVCAGKAGCLRPERKAVRRSDFDDKEIAGAIITACGNGIVPLGSPCERQDAPSDSGP